MAELWTITWFSVATALAATVLMVPPGLALGWVLARRRFAGKALVETLVSLPLVLPPVATGYILLRVLGRRSSLGRWLEDGGLEILFTWKAVVLAMTVMGFPLFVRTVRAGFEQVNERFEQVAATLGASVHAHLLQHQPAAGAALRARRRDPRLLARARRVRRDGDGRRAACRAGPGRWRSRSTPSPKPGRTGPPSRCSSSSSPSRFVAVWISNRLAAS